MVHKKIIEVMKAIEYLKKDDEIGFGRGKYKAISEEKVTTAVREQLIAHGLTIYPIKMEHSRSDYEAVKDDGKVSVMHFATVDVTYRVTDIEDESFIEVVSSGTGVDSQDKAVGKAMTYAYKYLLLRLFAIPTGEDPDKVSSKEIDNKYGKTQMKITTKPITAKEIQILIEKGASKGFSETQIEKSINKNYKVSMRQLTYEQYQEVLNKLN